MGIWFHFLRKAEWTDFRSYLFLSVITYFDRNLTCYMPRNLTRFSADIERDCKQMQGGCSLWLCVLLRVVTSAKLLRYLHRVVKSVVWKTPR